MKLKWCGTATILLEHEGARLLFDPFLARNSKVFQPSLDELAAARTILLTHGHLDHAVDVPKILSHGLGKSAVYCTAAPCNALLSQGVDAACLHTIVPGDILNLRPFTVRVLKGRHIVFDVPLLLRTLINPRVLLYWSNFWHMFKANKIYAEAGETVVYDIDVAHKRILLMGSLNLDDATEYPTGVDLLVLPFQGRSDIARYALPIIEWLQPKRVLLDHYDNTFPPLSSAVKTGPFIAAMQKEHSAVQVLCLQPGADWLELE